MRRAVGPRHVQQLVVEKHGGPRRQLHRNPLVLVEALRFQEARIDVGHIRLLVRQHRPAMRPRNHPEAPVLDRGRIQRRPHRAPIRRLVLKVVRVLVIRLPLPMTRRLHDELLRDALQLRPQQLSRHRQLRHPPQQPMKVRVVPVRMVQLEHPKLTILRPQHHLARLHTLIPFHNVIVHHIGGRRRQPRRVLENLATQRRRHQFPENQKPLVIVLLNLCGAQLHVVRLPPRLLITRSS